MVSVYFVGPTYPLVTVQPRRSADQPLSSFFLFLLRVQTCCSFFHQRSPLASLSFFHLDPPRGFYCSPCFFQGHFSSIFLSSFQGEEFPFFLLLLLFIFFFVSRFSNTQSSLLRVDRNTSNYRIDDDTWMNRKDFHIDLRDNFFPNLFSFFRIDIYVSIGCASFYPQEKLKRSRRYTHSSCTHTYRDPTATFISPFPNVEIRDCGLG